MTRLLATLAVARRHDDDADLDGSRLPVEHRPRSRKDHGDSGHRAPPPATTDTVAATLTLTSNAPSDPSLRVPLIANFSPVVIGAPAPDFVVAGYAGGPPFHLADHLGQVVLLKFFNFG